MEIRIRPITKKGIEVLKEHFCSTKLKDRIIMRSLGVKQKLLNNSLIITIDNLATRMMEKRDPAKLRDYLLTEQNRLTDPIDKMGAKKGKDYEVVVE